MKYKKIFKYIIIFVLFFIFIVACMFIDIKIYNDYKEKLKDVSLAKYMAGNNDVSSHTLPEEPLETYNEPTEKMLKLRDLHNENEDIVAWLSIPDTSINYPVVIGKDNSYYLNRNYKKEYSARGSLFLDKDTDLKKPSDNFLIYGHRNKSGAMFEDLMKYQKEDFYKSHKKIYFTTLDDDREFEILAAFRSKVYYKSDTNVFRYYYFVNSKNEDEFNMFVQNAKKASLYETGIDAKYKEQLITLSTCAYHTEDGRFAVVAKELLSN